VQRRSADRQLATQPSVQRAERMIRKADIPQIGGSKSGEFFYCTMIDTLSTTPRVTGVST
jgi:hypothetical protein